jgi:hypothetical protein
VGFVSLGFHRGWLANRPGESVSTVFCSLASYVGAVAFAVLAIGFSSDNAFAQGLGAVAATAQATIVPAIPELSPSSSEAEALFKLASRLEAGDATVARDDVLARRLYRIAADAGHAGAQCNLGAMLMDGSGGPTDLAGGAALFRKAALRGHGLAQYNLGVMHALGDGVIKDSGEAMAWIEQAITRLPEGEAMTSAKAWREHLRNRMSSREGMIARNRSQELGDAIVRELAAASTGSASRAARSAVRAGLDELGLSPEALQRLGLAPSGAALVGGSDTKVGGGYVGGNQGGANAALSRSAAPVGSNNVSKTVNTPASTLPTVAVETALQEWLKAWSDRRADDYLNFYDPRFAPLGGVDRAVWAKQRRSALRQPNWVKVRAEQISSTEMSPEEMVVGFVQVYSASTGHRETTRKSMIWRWSDGHWRIVSEQATKMAAAAGQDVALARVEPAQSVEAKAPEQKVAESKPLEPKASVRVQRESEPGQSTKAQRELEAARAALAKAQRDADAAQAKANQEAEAIQARAQREAELAQAKSQREAEAAQLRMQRDAQAAQLKAQRNAELAAARVKREAELVGVRAELESKQAAAKAARETQINAEKAAREAEVAANQAKREAEAAAANARKQEKRLAKEILSVEPAATVSAAAAPVVFPATPPAALPAVYPASSPAPLTARPPVAPNATSTVSSNSTSISSPNAALFEPAVRAWIKAWNDRQVDTYLASYAANFEVPGGQDRATWAAERRESMMKPAWIKVRADRLKTLVDGESAEASFFQVYVVAPGTVELSNKTMRWTWLDGRWQIVQEQSEPHARMRVSK